MAIYVQGTSSGDIFQAVGVVNARNLNGDNVQFEPTLSQSLQDYQQWLTQQGNGNNPSGGGSTTRTFTGKVLRISSVQQGTNTVYYLQIEGQSNIFTANLALSPKLPLVQSGDVITGTYQTGGGTVVNLRTFDDTSINLGVPATGVTPTPAAKPTAVPKK